MILTGYEKAVLCFPGIDDEYEKKIMDKAQKEADNYGYCELKHGDYVLLTVESDV